MCAEEKQWFRYLKRLGPEYGPTKYDTIACSHRGAFNFNYVLKISTVCLPQNMPGNSSQLKAMAQ